MSLQNPQEEAAMKIRHLTQLELAERWRISEATLERWRSEGLGPQYLKLHGRVLYRLVDIEAYEEACIRVSARAGNESH